MRPKVSIFSKRGFLRLKFMGRYRVIEDEVWSISFDFCCHNDRSGSKIHMLKNFQHMWRIISNAIVRGVNGREFRGDIAGVQIEE